MELLNFIFCGNHKTADIAPGRCMVGRLWSWRSKLVLLPSCVSWLEESCHWCDRGFHKASLPLLCWDSAGRYGGRSLTCSGIWGQACRAWLSLASLRDQCLGPGECGTLERCGWSNVDNGCLFWSVLCIGYGGRWLWCRRTL